MENLDDSAVLKRRLGDIEKENIELRRRVEFLELCRDNTGNWEAFRDHKGKFIYISPAFEAITGYDCKEYINGTGEIKDLIHPDDIEKFSAFLHAQDMKQPVKGQIIRLIDRLRNLKFIIASSRPLFDHSNEFIGTTISCIEISGIMWSGHEPGVNETALQTIFNNAHEGIILIDKEGCISAWNETVEKMTGFPGQKVLGQYVWDVQYSFLADEQKESLTAEFLREAWKKEVFKLEPGQHTSGQGEILTMNGNKILINDFIKPVMIRGEKFYCIFQHYALTE
jgi:PAS domain S-box-containing protein